jgi:hypothetical protein
MDAVRIERHKDPLTVLTVGAAMAAPHATPLAVPAVIVIVAGRGGSPQASGEVGSHERAVSSLFAMSTTGKAPWRLTADGALP